MFLLSGNAVAIYFSAFFLKNFVSILFLADISFAVTPSNQVTYSNGHILKFDKILNNNGNAYNPTTGTFTAPFNGTYEFSIVMLNANNGYAARAQVTHGSLIHNHVQSDGKR